MLRLEKRLPSGSVEGEKSIIVDTVACGAVLAYDLPHRTVGPGHLRPRWPSSDLGGQRRDEWRRQRGREDCQSPPHRQFPLTPLEGVPCSNRSGPAQCRTYGGCSTACWTSSPCYPGKQCGDSP